MGHFATGVAVVTGREPGSEPYGLTVNSVASVSLEPPLVLVCVARGAESHDRLVEARGFGVNFLGADDEWLARLFSEGERDERFTEVAFEEGATGAPILKGVLGWLDCIPWRAYDGGDHSILVGEVRDCGAREGEPLVFLRGRYREGLG